MKSRSNKRIWIAVIAVVLLLVLAGDFLSEDRQTREVTGYAMGSAVSLKYTGGSEEKAAAAIKKANEDDAYLSRNAASAQIAVLNEKRTAEVPGRTAEVIKEALALCRKSGGALDVTMGRLTDFWNRCRDENAVPDEKFVADYLKNVGYKKVSVRGNTVSVPDGCDIDLGAIGKGAACDSVIAFAKTNGIDNCIVSVGGSLGMYGKKDGWTVGVRNPDASASDTIGVIRLEKGFVSTSGDYEKYYEAGGVRYHHILDPKTGFPARSGLRQVTVISDSGLVSDGLSTACFVLGYKDSRSLLKMYGAAAVFVTDDNKVYVCGDADFTLTSDGYRMAG